jgi:uncharacterized protein (DUF58 family)
MLYPDFNELVTFKDKKSHSVCPSDSFVKSSVSGNHRSLFRGQGLEFDSVRKYVPGDDIRNIDWRVTARTGAPHLKIFREERERTLMICVDMNTTMRFGTRNTFKSIQAARVAALLGWRGLAYQDRVSACLFGDVPNGIQFFAPKRARKSFSSMLKMLAEPVTELHNVSFEQALTSIGHNAQSGTLIFFISDFMDVEEGFQHYSDFIRLNKRCEVVFIAINDQMDQQLYPFGTMGFCLGKEKIYVDAESEKGRAAYASQWKKNRNNLYEVTTKYKIPIIELSTESDIRQELTLKLRNIARRKK